MAYKAYVIFNDGTCRQWTGLRYGQALWRYKWLCRNAYKMQKLADWKQIGWKAES